MYSIVLIPACTLSHDMLKQCMLQQPADEWTGLMILFKASCPAAETLENQLHLHQL